MNMLALEIEKIKNDNDSNYIDALVHFSQINNIEIELLAETIKNDFVLTSKLQVDAENLNFLKKGSKLPI